MYADINLSIKKDSHVLQQEQVKKIKLISFSTLFLVAFASILIFLINLRFSVNSIKSEQNKAIQKIADNNQTAARIFLINSRLSDIDFILKNRKKYNQALGQIISLNSRSTHVTELDLKENKVTLSLLAASLTDLNDSLNAVLSSYPTKEVSDILMKSLKADATGFTIKLEVALR